MGIRFNCPNGHKLNVKEFLAGKRGVCPQCGAKFIIPVLAEPPAAQTMLPEGAVVSSSIEIAVLPNQPISATQIPSTPLAVAPLAESELKLAPAESIISSLVEPQPTLVADEIPICILPVQPSLTAAPPIIESTDIASPKATPRRFNQVVISFLLLILVIVLAGVLAWVLKREANREPVENTEKAAASCAPSGDSYRLSIPMCSIDSSHLVLGASFS